MKYEIIVPVTSARGTQVFEVEARNEKHAKELWDKGKVTFVCEEIEVVDTGEPEINPVEDRTGK